MDKMCVYYKPAAYTFTFKMFVGKVNQRRWHVLWPTAEVTTLWHEHGISEMACQQQCLFKNVTTSSGLVCSVSIFDSIAFCLRLTCTELCKAFCCAPIVFHYLTSSVHTTTGCSVLPSLRRQTEYIYHLVCRRNSEVACSCLCLCSPCTTDQPQPWHTSLV